MHPTLEQLLDLRDGDAPAEIVAHVDVCDTCAEAVAGLRATRDALRGLPPVEAPSTAWAAVERGRAHRRTPRWLHGFALAAAASVVMAVALTAMLRGPTGTEVPVGTDDEVERLVMQSRDLERLLAQLEPGSRVLDFTTAGTIVALEDRIASVDSRLRYADSLDRPATERLLRQRVQLMDALVTVHAAHAQPTWVETTL